MESQELKRQIGEVGLDLALGDPFAHLDDLLNLAEEEGLLPLVITETAPALKDSGVNPARYYQNAFAQFRLGAPEAAWPVVLSLAGKLEQGEHWRPLALLTGRALEYSPRVEGALHVAKAFESAGLDELNPALLHKAYDLYPDESRLAYLMGELKAREAAGVEGGVESDAGQQLLEEARSYWAESLDGFVTQKRHAQVEEAFLRIADSQDPAILKHLIFALRKLGEQALWGRLDTCLELALPALRKAGMVQEVWNVLLRLLPSAPPASSVRKHLRELAVEAFPDVEGILDLLKRSGVLEPEVKVESALKSLEPLLLFAPGYYVLHASWGVGRIRLNDGETLILDFRDTTNHRMSVTLARRALQVVQPDDLRVMRVQDPAAIKRQAKEDPAAVAFLAIRQLGGEASTQEIKRAILAEEVLTASQWSGWWKEAKAAMEQDDRFDMSQAFRQTYRIRSAGQEETIALPTLEPRRGIRPNLNLIRRFLEQHPAQTARAARTYSSILQRWGRQERTSAEESMAVALQIHRWTKKVDDEFVDAMRRMLQDCVEASVFPDEEDQKLIIEVGLPREDMWKETVYFALSSRYASIRHAALARLSEDPDTGRSLLHALIAEPELRPLAAMNAINLAVTGPGKQEFVTPEIWESAIGAASLAESTTREPLRKQALTLLNPTSSMVEQLLKTPPSDVQLQRVATLVRRWRSSERFLQPLLNILRRAGHESLVRDLREERMARTNQMLLSQAEQELEYPDHLMTRRTFERLKEEMERLNYELKTTVAQAIAKARALGDLSENAEFESARMKQADFAARVANIALRLRESKIIDELPRVDGRVVPGTQVEIEDMNTGDMRTYWLLGEGDDVLGPEVISHTAPLGRALLGLKLSDRVRLPAAGTTHEFVVRQIVRRLPDGPATSPAAREPEVSTAPVAASAQDTAADGVPARDVGEGPPLRDTTSPA